QGGEVDSVETPDVDIDLVRIGARHVEARDPTGRTEMMTSGARAELIGRKRILAREELESIRRHDQMKETLLRADGTVALGDAVELGAYAKANATAVAATLVESHVEWISRRVPC